MLLVGVLLLPACGECCHGHRDAGSYISSAGWGPATNTPERDLDHNGVISIAEAEETR